MEEQNNPLETNESNAENGALDQPVQDPSSTETETEPATAESSDISTAEGTTETPDGVVIPNATLKEETIAKAAKKQKGKNVAGVAKRLVKDPESVVHEMSFGGFIRAFAIAFIIVLIIFFIYAVYGMASYRGNLANQEAIMRSNEEEKMIDEDIKYQFSKLYEMAPKLSECQTIEEVASILSLYIGGNEFGNLNFYYHGDAYDANGEVIHSIIEPAIAELISQSKPAVSDHFMESIEGATCIAFYIPIVGSPVIDGLVSQMRDVEVPNCYNTLVSTEASSAFITVDGTIITSMYGDDVGEYTFGKNIYTFIKDFSGDKTIADDFKNELLANGVTAQQFSTNDGNYIIYGSIVESANSHFAIVSVAKEDVFLTEAYTYAYQIIVVSVIAILVLLITLIYFFFFYKQKTTELKRSSYINAEFNVPNLEKFKLDAIDRMANSPNTRYAVMYFRIDSYQNFVSQIKDSDWYNVMQYLFKIVSIGFNDTAVSTHREIYGYEGNGEFALLYTYGGRQDELMTYTRLLNAVVNKNEILQKYKVGMTIRAGVYIVSPNQNTSVAMALTCARKALELESKQSGRDVYLNIYSNETEQTILNEARIEMKMEAALANGDFKAFLQPKYSFKKDAIDSAEALVRWFDPDRGIYTYPVDFIYLFESNGFITKMDHFIYVEICKYFAEAQSRGDPMVPVSVNVSRVTAAQSDFLKFYTETKKKHGVNDGLLTIEFTESFAMENYELLANISEQLHANGISCSIDDFGSGYSSFNMLKNVRVDELKMDYMFLKKGLSPERDDLIIQLVLNMGKSLRMKVVQEGCETKEQFEKLKAWGCDVIQGYYYSKAIPMEEYKIFVRSNTSIRYKAKVK